MPVIKKTHCTKKNFKSIFYKREEVYKIESY